MYICICRTNVLTEATNTATCYANRRRYSDTNYRRSGDVRRKTDVIMSFVRRNIYAHTTCHSNTKNKGKTILNTPRCILRQKTIMNKMIV